ncbi:succinate dehydrogenase cytochrome b558 subunit [Lentibacillus sp. L22]|uniref:succinate dehydrogenase cytochrome b558 subunit n=1 Tax=Lentibacillus TaxID=175304 RepID=UPI0022B122B3|nr:succinate dehydrogenase cytochrome b558 subunit [Lentibacillus daqui]
MVEHREFGYRRLHSLLGVIPVGLFLIVHLVVNYFAVYGEESFNKASEFMESLPFLIVLEFVLIYLPILFHAILGVYIVFVSKNNYTKYGYFRNWMYFLQRVTGIITFIYIVWHVWETRIQIWLGNASLDFSLMENILSNPVMFWVYIIGLISTTFHFANGLWSFLVSWGFTQSPRSQKIATYVTLIIFLVISYIGVRSLLTFAYGI